MNWDAISAVSETIASIAVVISLVYLALQVKQSNQLSKSQTRTELRHMAQSEVYKVIDNPVINAGFYRDELTEEESIKLHCFLVSAIRFREFIWRQHQLGLLDTPTFTNYSMAILQILGARRCRNWWNAFKLTGGFEPAFVNFVDELLEKHGEVDIREFYKMLQQPY